MTLDEMKNLKVGDIIRSDATEQPYIVTANYGGRVTAVQTVDITNPEEWRIFSEPKLVTPLELERMLKNYFARR